MDPAKVLEIFADHLAPAIISCDSPMFLALIPAAPTRASMLFDMIVSRPRRRCGPVRSR
jgi:hypothetical protein